MDNSFAFSEVVRKLANIIRLGKIAEIDGDQVRVEIGRVKTGWLPIVSNAGNTSLWLPISEGEQVAVFSPYGEMAQAFVLRSIHYNTYKVPENVNNLSLTTDKNVKFSSPEKYEASFSKGLKFVCEKCVISLDDHGITLKVGNSTISLGENSISLSNGASNIDISESNISLSSGSITTNPPVCKCSGGM